MSQPNNLLKYEDWEGKFAASHTDFLAYETREPRDFLGLYRTIGRVLFFPRFTYWKSSLLILSAVYISLQGYLSYRQYRKVQQSSRPKVLRNVLSEFEFIARRKHQLLTIRVEMIALLWRFICIYLVVIFNLLPLLWLKVHILKTRYIDKSLVSSYSQTFGHDPQLPLFYLASAFLWVVLLAPILYVQTCIIGSGPPNFMKNTSFQVGLVIAEGHFSIFWKVWLLIYFEEGDMLQDEYRKGGEIWNSILSFGALYAVWILIVHPLVPPGYLNLTSLRSGKTRGALEGLAKDYEFPLGEIYTSLSSGSSEEDISISGWPRRRNIVIPESVLEKCSTEEVVALVAAEMGNLKHNPFQQVGMKFLKYGMLLIPIWSLHNNWQYVVKDFGLDKEYLSQGRQRGELFTKPHPFFVVVLMLGGALDPMFRVGTIIVNSLSREIDARADALAVKRGHGKQLAKALLKIDEVETSDCDIVVDKYYSLFYHSNDVLPVILDDLGWTGEENVEDEKDMVNEHWDTGITLKGGLYWKRDGGMTELLDS